MSGGKIESCTYLFTCKAEKLYHISWIGHQESRLHINKTHCRHSSFTSYENKMGIEDGTKVHLFGVGDIEHTPNESCNLLDYARSPTPPSPLLIEHHKSYCSLEKTHSTSVGSPPHWPHSESFRSLRRTSFPLGTINRLFV